ncbi:hypothetical protein KR032_008082, partial [Drosophila birchii]
HGAHGSPGSPGSQESQMPHGYMNEPSDDVGLSSPAMSHHDHEASGHKRGHDGESMMPMVFHGGSTETILFNWWRTQSAAAMSLSCLLVFIVAILYEGLKFYREWLFRRNRADRLNAGRDNYGHSRHHRERYYACKQPVYSFRPQAQPLPQMAQPRQHMPHSMGTPIAQPQQMMPSHHHHHHNMSRGMGPPTEQSSHLMSQHNHHMPLGTGQHHIQEPNDRDAGRNIPWHRRWCSQMHLIQTLLHVLQVLISFLLMLVFMTFNIWLALAVLLGAGVGYYIFGAFSDKINEHCN